MSENLAKWAKLNRKSDRPQEDQLHPGEEHALKKIQQEAKKNHSELASGGKGGLPPSLVLGVMRRDKWRCKKCGELGSMKENGGLSVHHKSEHLEAPKAKMRSQLLHKEHKVDSQANVVSLCAKCHDKVHEQDRAENDGAHNEQGAA